MAAAWEPGIECTLAQSQIRLYVAGEELPPETMAQLEAHLAQCKGCRASVEEQRHALSAPRPKSRIRLPFLTPERWRATKPFVLSVLLAFVLLGMSSFTKWSGAILGPKASESAATAKTEPEPAKSEPGPIEQPPPQPAVPAASVEPTAPKPQPAPHKPAAPKVKPRPKPSPSASDVRVYAPDGKPIESR